MRGCCLLGSARPASRAGLLAAGVYFSKRAAMHGGTVLTVLAAVTSVVGVLGFVVLARIVVLVERQRRQ